MKTVAERNEARRIADERERLRGKLRRPAQAAVSKALKNGSLIRQPCEVCGSLCSEAHHADYSKPLKVQWFCRKHHCREHAMIRKELSIRIWSLKAFLKKQQRSKKKAE